MGKRRIGALKRPYKTTHVTKIEPKWEVIFCVSIFFIMGLFLGMYINWR